MKALVVVDNRVRVRIDSRWDCAKSAMKAIKAAFTHSNPAFFRAKATDNPQWLYGIPKTIETWEMGHSANRFADSATVKQWERLHGKDDPRYHEWIDVPRGGMSRMREALLASGIEYAVIDARIEGDSALMGQIPKHEIGERKYQIEAIDAALAKQNSIIRAPTASGKTEMAFVMISRVNVPTLVIVTDRGLFKQWFKRAKKVFKLKPEEIGRIQGKVCEIRPLTIAMQKTLAMRGAADDEWLKEIASKFGMVLCDEVQRFAANTMFAAVDPFPARYRIGISADERRKDEKEFLIYDLFGAVACDIDRERLEKEGWVLDVKIRVVMTDLKPPQWYKRIPAIPKEEWPPFNAREYGLLIEEIVSDQNRNAMVLKLARDIQRAGKQMIVWSLRREHCVQIDADLVKMGIPSGLLIGGADFSATFDATVTGLESGRLRAGVGTVQAVAQALNIPALSRGILTIPLATNKQQTNQCRGRICRSDLNMDAELYYLLDAKIFGLEPLENLIRWYKKSVTVWDGSKWVDGRAYVKRYKKSFKPDKTLGGIFA